MEPRVSVIITSYNCPQYVAEAIESVLAQTVMPFEIIVVDGSDDETTDVVRGYGSVVKLITIANAGCGVARNTGIDASSGNLIAFLDCDDIWTKDKLEVQLQCFKARPEIDAVFGEIENFVSPELTLEQKSKINCPPGRLQCTLPNVILVKKESFLRVGYFDPKLWRAEGVDWRVRAEDMGLAMEELNHLVYYRRLFKMPKSQESLVHVNDYAKVIKKALDRRRAMSS